MPRGGQGALGFEFRLGDPANRSHLAFLNHLVARAATTCERALLNSLGGGCQVPIGAYAEMRMVSCIWNPLWPATDGPQNLSAIRATAMTQKNWGTTVGAPLCSGAAATRFSNLYTAADWPSCPTVTSQSGSVDNRAIFMFRLSV